MEEVVGGSTQSDSQRLAEALRQREILIKMNKELVAALKIALQSAESWVHDQLDGTRFLQEALDDLSSCHTALKNSEYKNDAELRDLSERSDDAGETRDREREV